MHERFQSSFKAGLRNQDYFHHPSILFYFILSQRYNLCHNFRSIIIREVARNSTGVPLCSHPRKGKLKPGRVGVEDPVN